MHLRGLVSRAFNAETLVFFYPHSSSSRLVLFHKEFLGSYIQSKQTRTKKDVLPLSLPRGDGGGGSKLQKQGIHCQQHKVLQVCLPPCRRSKSMVPNLCSLADWLWGAGEGNWAVEAKDWCARAIKSFVLFPFRLGMSLDEKCRNPSILYLLLLYVFCSFYTI